MRHLSRVVAAAALLLLAACQDQPVAPEPSFGKQPPPPPPTGSTPIDLSNNGATLGRAVSIDVDGWILGQPASNEGVLIWGPGSDGVPGGAPQPTDPLGDIKPGSTNRYGDAVGGVYDWGLFAYLVGTDSAGQRVYRRAGPLKNDIHPGNNGNDINDDRVIVGAIGPWVAVWPAWDAYPVLWTSSPYPAACPGTNPPYGVAVGVNNHGLMVGRLGEQLGRANKARGCTYDAVDHAWMWRFDRVAGTIESLGELPRDPTAEGHGAGRINDDGVIAGGVRRNGKSYPARWAPDVPGGSTYTRPPVVMPYPTFTSLTVGGEVGVNRCGYIAGAVRPSGASGDRGFVWDGVAAPILLSGLAGSAYNVAMDINDNGDVVGYSVFTPTTGSTYRNPTLWRGVVPPCP